VSVVFEAVKVALDPTPAQERLLLSHTGAARFAFNAGLAHVKAGIDTGAKPEWSYYALVRWWNANKDALAVNADGTPWWAENSKEAANTGLRSLAAALSNWAKSRKGQRKGKRVGFPRFRAKDRATPRFAYTTGRFGLIDGDPKALRLPRIGRVHCMEDVTARVGDARVLRMAVSRRAGRTPPGPWAGGRGAAAAAVLVFPEETGSSSAFTVPCRNPWVVRRMPFRPRFVSKLVVKTTLVTLPT